MSRDPDGDPCFGEPSMKNMFEGKDINVKALSAGDERYTLMAFTQDGAIIIDGVSGQITCGNYMVGNILKGVNGMGARHKAASAIAQQAGGCFVIKSSEDACAHGVAEFSIF